jgi:hypothetical protein
MPGTLQNHVHEARAPKSAAAGWIAADIATRFGDDIRHKATTRKLGFIRIPARRVTVSMMTMMTIPMMPDVMMMFVVMNVRVMSRTMMRPCRGRRCERNDCQGTHRQCQDTRQPAQHN